jgi:hypothetical protein
MVQLATEMLRTVEQILRQQALVQQTSARTGNTGAICTGRTFKYRGITDLAQVPVGTIYGGLSSWTF